MKFIVHDYIAALKQEFEANADPKIAKQQKAYLRNQFEFYGIKTPIRRQLQKPFLRKAYLPAKESLKNIVLQLWQKPQREYHYFAQELTQKFTKQFKENDLTLIEYLISTNSWWDTVDFIATKLVKMYFKKFPNQRDPRIEKWLASENIWLQRTCVIFQLMEKDKTDLKLLEHVIYALLESKEFFINKAIGWALRDYSRTDPEWVLHFVERTPLHPLSKREALRLIN